MRLSSRGRKLALLVAGAAVISALAAGPALAGKRPPAPTNAQCWVTPNPVSNDVAGNQLYVNGAGFAPNTQYAIFIGGTIEMAVSNENGNFSVWDWATKFGEGVWNVVVYRAGDRHMTVLAACSMTVS